MSSSSEISETQNQPQWNKCSIGMACLGLASAVSLLAWGILLATGNTHLSIKGHEVSLFPVKCKEYASLASYIAISIGSFGLGILCMVVFNKCKKKPREEQKPDNNKPSSYERADDGKAACNHIMGGLWLGNATSFAQTTGFACKGNTNKGVPCTPYSIDVSNPKGFETIITVCHLQAIAGPHIELLEKTSEEYASSFAERDITWHHVGKMAADDSTYWEALVYDCTYLDGEFSHHAFPMKEGEQFFDEIRDKKAEVTQTTPIQDWFAPIFKAIDQAVLHGKKVLVHCYAGQSRSSTIIAAYLINRFGMSGEEALALLQSKRSCVKSNFADQLNQYANDLAAAKANNVLAAAAH